MPFVVWMVPRRRLCRRNCSAKEDSAKVSESRTKDTTTFFQSKSNPLFIPKKRTTNGAEATPHFGHHNFGKRARDGTRTMSRGARQHDLGCVPLALKRCFTVIYYLDAPLGASRWLAQNPLGAFLSCTISGARHDHRKCQQSNLL